MTSPAPPATAPAQQQAQQQDDQLSLAVAAVLVSAISAQQALSALMPTLRTYHVSPSAMQGALSVVMSFPPEQIGAAGPASLATSRQNLIRRAQFAVASARRLQRVIVSARSHGRTARQALEAGVAAERRYYGQHLAAIWGRATAAAQVDSAAASYGNILGWNTVHDAKTSAECKAADGKNFYADIMPLIGFPGAVHPHCRCYPGPPYKGARMLPSARALPVRAVR
jgi:hypothetical protein